MLKWTRSQLDVNVLTALEWNAYCLPEQLSEECAKQKFWGIFAQESLVSCQKVRALQRGCNADFVFRCFVIETDFNVDKSDIYNILFRIFISHILFSVSALSEMRIYISLTLPQLEYTESAGYIFIKIIIHAETYKCRTVTICFLNISGYSIYRIC